MIDISNIDYSYLDRPEILMLLFHPRPEWDSSESNTEDHDVLIPVEHDIVVGGRFHMTEKSAPNILFISGCWAFFCLILIYTAITSASAVFK